MHSAATCVSVSEIRFHGNFVEHYVRTVTQFKGSLRIMPLRKMFVKASGTRLVQWLRSVRW